MIGDQWGLPFYPLPRPGGDEGYPVFGNGTVDRGSTTAYADVRVHRGEFRFGALGPDRRLAVGLLATSPALTRRCIVDRTPTGTERG